MKYIILSHLGLGDNIWNIALINHLTKCIDCEEVQLVCKKTGAGQNSANMQYILADNTKAKLYIVDDDVDISPNFGCPIEKFNKITERYTVLVSGGHSRKKSNITSFPFFMYDDIGISRNVLKNDFFVRDTEKSMALLEALKQYTYCFVSCGSSNGNIFSVDILIKYGIDKSKVVVICPEKNIYNTEDPFYGLVQQFTYRDNNIMLLDYKLVIENAFCNIMTDSAMFCLAVQLNIKTDKNYLINRVGNMSLDWDGILAFYGNKFQRFK